jgi:hypothetical protein
MVVDKETRKETRKAKKERARKYVFIFSGISLAIFLFSFTLAFYNSELGLNCSIGGWVSFVIAVAIKSA